MRPLTRTVIALTLATAGGALAQERPTLSLSLEEAVKRALESNLDIAVERYAPEASAFQIAQVKGAYDVSLSATLSDASRSTPGTSFLVGGAKVSTDTSVWNFGASRLLETGGSLSLAFNNNRQDTNNTFTTFNPLYNSNLTASLTQPLLRSFKVDSTRNQLRIAKRNKEISDTQFRQIVINTLATVKQQYYDLIAAIDNLQAQRKSLSLAQKLLEENRIKVRVGTMAPLDVVQAESEVASREEGVIMAEAAVGETEDALKRAIFPRNEPELWPLRILPTDRPAAEPIPIDAEAAIERALSGRTDIAVARKQLQTAEDNMQLARNQTLPGLDLQATYGGTGAGGTQIRNSAGPLPAPIPGGYGDAVNTINDYTNWSIGVSVSYPILNRSAKATEARSRLAVEQARTSLARLEMQIASEIRSAARSVETNMKRVQSTRAAKVLQQQRLDAEEKKFSAGMSTNFLVTQAQRDLSLAEVGEVRAVADYRKSVVTFERIQEAGSGGSGGTITVTISGTGGTGSGTGATLARGGGTTAGQ